MTRVVLTRKMLDMIRTGICDRETILNDEISYDPLNKKQLEEEMKTCEKITAWALAVERKRGYHD